MAYQIDKLDETRRNGVLITGLAQQDLQNENTRQRLRDLWVEHGLVVFKSKVTPDFHVESSRVFGPLEAHPVKEYQLKDNPEILNAVFDPDDTDLWSIDGAVLGAWTPWHSDLVFLAAINHGGILRPHEVAAEGGATGFIDKIEAYDTLPDTIKARIDDLDVVYRLRIDFREQKFVPRLNKIDLVRTHAQRIESVRMREDQDFPPVVHPLVFVQPETGRKALNLSPAFAEYIYGMGTRESDQLLSFLINHITDPKLQFFHLWQCQDEMILWDNWRMLHQAAGCPATIRRVMYRTTIAGDYQQGKTLAGYETARAMELAQA
jgi:taurine dioxygenase